MKTNSLAVLVWLSFLGLLFTKAGAQGIAGPTNGLVCYYRFNGNANDALGKGNAGVLYNGAYYTNGIAGQANGAVWCDGAGGYVLMGKNETVYPNQILTWSLWVRPEAGANGPAFWDDDEQSGGDRGLVVAPTLVYGGGLFFNVLPTDAPLISPNPLTPKAWHHLALTSDAAGQSLYVDGVQVATRNLILADHTGRSSVSFGAGNDAFEGPNSVYAVGFKGAICDARIYQRALSANEVAEVYNAESGLPSVGSGSLVTVNRAVSLSFSNLVAGAVYQVRAAASASGPFTNYARPFLATNSIMPFSAYWNVADGNQRFFRVEAP
jgi:concanavalin A-like lectin/glucanase superfamily protein